MTIFVPDTARVIDVARQARARGLHLITDGRRTLLSARILPGWTKVSVRVKR